MRHTHSLNTSTLRLIKSWHLLLVAAFVLLASVGFAAFLYGHTAAFATPSLGTAQNFAVLAGSTVTNTGPTAVSGDLGVWPGLAIVGFPPGIVTGGTIHAGDPVAMQAQSDLTTAYNALAGTPCTTNLTGQDLGGQTLPPGVYCFNTSAQLTGILTLDAQGDPNAVFIFQMGSTLTTASNSAVRVINGGQNCNAFWQVGSSATFGIGTAFVGSVLAQASITLTTGSSLSGRALARTGAVTMDTNAVSVCSLISPAAPALGKVFSPATINAGGVSTLTITLINPNAGAATLTAPFTDTLPAGVLIAPIPNASTTCGGVVTATAGGSTVTLTGGAIPGGAPGTCTITVDVTAALGGSYLNTIPAGALQTSNGNNAAPASATLTVIPPGPGPPLLSKAFSPATINAGGVSTLTITLINPNAGAATLTAPLTDTLPLGVVIAPVPNASTTCGGGTTVTAVAGGTTVTLPTGRSIPGGSPGTCTITVNVTAALAGNYLNTLPAGALQTSNGNNVAPASATLTVISVPLIAPTLSKAFNPATINAGGVSTLTITLSNLNASPAILTVPLTDTLPSGVVIAAVPNASTTCPGSGAVAATAGGTTVTLPVGRSIPGGAPGTCTVMVNVTAPDGGVFLNTLPVNALQTSNGNNVAAAIATLTVVNASGPPGSPFPPPSEVSDQKPGSVLVYNLYSSSIAAPNAQNTRISITNTNTTLPIAVHLFFVDGATCSIADSLVCLTPNQTASFLASDIDPGTTGYIVAVASDLVTGCPVSFNALIGDEYVKLSSGHAANLAAEAFAAVLATPTSCDAFSVTALLSFDGASYNRAPRVLAASNIPSRADGNDTLIVLNRIGGSLAAGAATLGSLFGIFYDDAENPLSFTFTAGVCQFRSSLSNNFPRTAPRFEQFIPAGRSGWAKFYSLSDIGLLGAQINFNPNAGTAANAFNQGHNLHKLSLTSAASLTIPIFPPNC